MTYVIENDYPVRENELTRTLASLEVGQSFLVNDRSVAVIRRAIIVTSKKLGTKYATRSTRSDDNPNATRIWRTA